MILLDMDPLPLGMFSTSTGFPRNYIIISRDIQVCGIWLVLEYISFAKHINQLNLTHE